MSLPKRIFEKIISLEKKFVTYPFADKVKYMKEKYDDNVLNRELLVTDKYGNRYYQHYSQEGIPTKRYVALNMKSTMKWDEDPTMLGWLQFRRQIAPSQEELEKIYIQQEEFERRGLEYDLKEQRLFEEYAQRRKAAIDQERAETQAIGEGDNFSPGRWKPKINKDKAISVLEKSEISEIPTWDIMEYENVHGLKGKYYVDFIEDDKRWMDEQMNKSLKPFVDKYETLDLSTLTPDNVSKAYNDEIQEHKNSILERKKELTNLGKRMMEKKEKYKEYNQFREKYRDIYEKFDFSI